MTNKLSFNFLPHRREFLDTSIGTKLRDDFAYNSFVPLPKVRLFSPDEARAAGFDPNKGLGWFNFQSTEIGILVFNDRPPDEAWKMATGVTVHEHLHWLWSLSPVTVGCQNESDRFVMNVFTDAANEQRAMIESRWAQKYLRRTRQMLLPKAWAGNVSEPLYRAGFFTLAVHTLLSVKGGRIMRRLHKSEAPETMAKELWTLCERQFGQKMPESEMETWLKAFSLSLQAWTADNDFTRFDIAQKFIALFPQPATEPPDNPLDMGGHMNDNCERTEGPSGSTKSGKPILSLKPGSKPNGNSDGSGAGNPATDEKDGDKKPGDSSGSKDKPEDGSDSKNGESDSLTPLAFDEAPSPDAEEKAELDQISQELTELNKPSKAIPGAIVTSLPGDKVYPTDPRELVKASQTDAAVLAERLRIVARPRGRTQDTRGRVVSRIVAFDPTAQKPFKNRVSAVKGFAPKVFVGFVGDTSGSMRTAGKIEAARRAGMTVHLACVKEKVAHLIATSRTLEMLAGKGVSVEKGNALIAGMRSHAGGDNYINMLPQLINLVQKRPEEVKVLLVLTDGMPGAKHMLKPMIDNARAKGVIVIGIGLQLNKNEIAGMKEIFGDGSDQTVIATVSGFARLTAEVLSNAVTRGSRRRVTS